MLYSIVQFYWCSGVRLLRKKRVAFPKDQRQEIRRVRREVQFSREICLSSGGIFSDMKWPLLFGKWFPEWTKLCDEKLLMKEREVINNNESSLYRFSRPDWVYSWTSVCMKVWSVVPYINRPVQFSVNWVPPTASYLSQWRKSFCTVYCIQM